MTQSNLWYIKVPESEDDSYDESVSLDDSVSALDFENNVALDTDATFISVKNKNMTANIRKAKHPILLCTNTGEQKIEKVSNIIRMDDKA